MPITKGGIYHNLKESEYTISNKEVVFFFSSKSYLQKFMSIYKSKRETVKYVNRKYIKHDVISLDILSDIRCYLEIEKRGFYVKIKGVEITSNELYRYASRKMIDKNTYEWFVIQKRK